MVKVMSYGMAVLSPARCYLTLSLIPYWNSAVIDQVDLNIADRARWHTGYTVWLGISIVVFAPLTFRPSSLPSCGDIGGKV